ncbi:MAG: hypothetical protein M0Z52_12390 [Actinomycetota bacterium]|nr:hypothetical protein [Actinomycetota bacterium]
MTASITERYALYLLHLYVGVMTGEMDDLARYGITPVGGRTAPLKKDLQEKISLLLAKLDEVLGEAVREMIAESASGIVSGRLGREETTAWIGAMLEELERRISFLGTAYKNNIERTKDLINEIEKLMAE